MLNRRSFITAMLAAPMVIYAGAALALPKTTLLGVFPGLGAPNITAYQFTDDVRPFTQKLSALSGVKISPELYSTLYSIKKASLAQSPGMLLLPFTGSVYAEQHGYTPVLMSTGHADDVCVKRIGVRVKNIASLRHGTFLNAIAQIATESTPGAKIVVMQIEDAIKQSLTLGVGIEAGTMSRKSAEPFLASGKFEIMTNSPAVPSYVLLIRNDMMETSNKIIAGADGIQEATIAGLQDDMPRPVGKFIKYDEANYLSFKTKFIKEFSEN